MIYWANNNTAAVHFLHTILADIDKNKKLQNNKQDMSSNSYNKMFSLVRLRPLLLVARVGYSLSITGGQFLAVEGDKFVYGGEKV